MEYVSLGKSGIKVSKVGIGLWQAIGGDEWNVEDERTIEGIGRAHDLAVNLVDTVQPSYMATATANR